MKVHTLKSGRTLEIGLADFRAGKNLFDAVIKEIKASKLDAESGKENFLKDAVLSVLSSENVERALWPCMAKCLYEKNYITPNTFEDISAREDFLEICYEVGQENLIPFGKNLYAELSPLLGIVGLSQG